MFLSEHLIKAPESTIYGEILPRYKLITSKEERIVHLLSFFDIFFKGIYFFLLLLKIFNNIIFVLSVNRSGTACIC